MYLVGSWLWGHEGDENAIDLELLLEQMARVINGAIRGHMNMSLETS